MSKIHPSSVRSIPLGIWLAFGFGAFVLTGSAALVVFFQHLGQLEARVALESLGRNNALFLDQSKLPQTPRMEAQLGQVMGAEVHFTKAGKNPEGRVADGGATRAGEMLSVGFPLRSGNEVWFSRKVGPEGMRTLWNRRDARLALVVFWSLSLLFSLWLSRMVTRPLAKLEAALPQVGGDEPPGPLPDRGPREIVRLAATLRDTHEAILDERGKRRHAERLALLGRMAASLAHEVRNPVAAIRLHAQLIERLATHDDDTAASARLIVAETSRIEALVNQWLHFAKPEPMTKVPVDMAALVGEVVQTLASQAAHAGVTVRVDGHLQPSGPRVPGDRERLRQVFGNLLLNAIQSMPMGGLVVIRVLPEVLEIEDQGAGFSAASLAALGQPFYSEREGGMGLGLAVSKEILNAHGAALHAENVPGGGALVRITWLPMKHPSV